ncbi:MAG TPA: CHAT domain-containing protein [Candidatus Polarisedimenticolia bacterium]|nr:CHAT domain-containing protein [Candidatus Polarisedimenticolia bacterium]
MKGTLANGSVFLALGLIFVSGCRCTSDPQTLYDRTALSIRRGDLKTAAIYVDQALARRCGMDISWSWRFRIQKALILASQSAPGDALSLLKGDLPPPLATSDVAVRKQMVEGMAYRISQDFGKAEERLNSAEELAARSQPTMLCEVMNYRGALDFQEKKYSQAIAAYQRALDLSRQLRRRDQEATALVGLALVAAGQEHFDEAIDRNQDALSLARTLDTKGLVSTALGNLGWSYFELGDFENSLDFYRQGAERSAQSGLSGYSAYWFSDVATAYLALRDYTQAEELARTTLKRARELKNAQTITLCNNTLAEIMLKTGRLSVAEQYNREALKMEEEGLDTFGTSDSLLMAGHIAAAQKRLSDAENSFKGVLGDPTVDTRRRWEAEAGLAQVWEDQGRFVEAERQYLKAINTIEQARRSVNHDELRLSFLSSGIAVYGEYIDFLIRRGRPADALNQAELSRARTLSEGLSSNGQVESSHAAPHVSPQQLAKRLNSTLLVYWLGEKHSYLWTVTPSKTAYFTLPPAAQIDPLIKSYREFTLKSGDLLQSAASTGEKLYASLVEPAKKLIPPGSRLILLPDASLYGLNFETLIVPGPQPHFWIEDVTVTTASSLSLLASAANRAPPKEKNLLLVGDALPVPEFGPLPQAPAEMQKIEQYFGEPRRAILKGPQATPNTYLSSEPGRFSYLHFVTHGTASRARPLESAVILSKEPSSDTYKLYARDIVQHRLNANLVTISACNGSGTRAYSGEGLVGLSWAFLRAGAHNVIGALWEVSDASTPQLMDALYRELSQGKDPATALRDAKLSLLHSSEPDSVFKKPFYWAPFQLYAGS